MATAERILAEAEAEEANQATAWTARKKALEKATGDARAKLSLVGRVVREKREIRAVEVVESRNHQSKTVLFELSKARRIEDGAGAEAQA